MPEYLFRDSPPHPIQVIGAEGSYIIDGKRGRLLDFASGWCVGNAGWNKKTIVRAIKAFKGPSYAPPSYQYARWEQLAEKLVSLLPGRRGTCFRATGGTEAVELALKISRAHNRRKKFIALGDAYHGQSLACMALVGLHEDMFGPYPDHFIRLNPLRQGWEKAAGEAVKAIRGREACAFVSEPVICNWGVVVPPKSFFEAVREACLDTDTVFIMDEVATGFGRTGKWFGFEHYGIEPDIVTLGKGFSSGYAAIGATIAAPAVAEAMRFDFSNYSTFGWHPLSVEAALANIEYIQKNRLVKKSEESGEYLMKRLTEFCEPEGKGLCIGFDVPNHLMAEQCLEDGLIVAGAGRRAMLFPALDVGKKEIDSAVAVLKKHCR